MSSVGSSERSRSEGSSRHDQTIMVIGVGGAGNDLITHMMDASPAGIHCLAVDTDPIHLQIAQAHSKLFVPPETVSLGTRGDVEAGNRVGQEAARELASTMTGANIVFVLAGMGGSTGTGAAPVISRTARENGSLVIGLVTHPFPSGQSRFAVAVNGIRSMLSGCHTVVMLDSQPDNPSLYTLPLRLTRDSSAEMCSRLVASIRHAFTPGVLSDEELEGLRKMLSTGGLARAAISESYSKWGAEEAVLSALRTALPVADFANARGLYAHIVGNQTEPQEHVQSALRHLNGRVNANAHFVYAKHSDPDVHGTTKVSLIATGIPFPYTWGGYRKVPLHLYELEPEAGEEQPLNIRFDLDQLEEAIA